MYGQEYSVVFPNQQPHPLDTYRQERAYYDQQRRYDQQVQQQRQDRQDQYLKWLMDELDPKTFATGTVYDPTVHQTLQGLLGKAAQGFKQGKGFADVYYELGPGVAALGQWTTKVRQKRAQMEQLVREYAKNPYIDENRLLVAGLQEAFTDSATGGMKDPAQISESDNPLERVLQRRPQDVYKGMDAFYPALEKMKDTEVGDKQGGRDKYGNEFRNNWKGRIKDWEEVYSENGDAKARLRLKEVTLPDGTKDRVLADDAYERVFTGDNAFMLEAEFNRRFGGAGLNAQQKDYLKRKLATELLTPFRPNNPIVNDDAQKQHVMPNVLLYPQRQQIYYGDKNQPPAVNDPYGHINARAAQAFNRSRKGLPMIGLPVDEQRVVLDLLNSVAKKPVLNEKGQPVLDKGTKKPVVADYTQEDVYLKWDPALNRTNIHDARTNEIKGHLSYTGTNLPKQADAKAKKATVQQGNQWQQQQAKRSQQADRQPGGGKVISKDAFRKMSIAERQQFISNGGKVN